MFSRRHRKDRTAIAMRTPYVPPLAPKILLYLSAGLGSISLLWILALCVVANREPNLVIVHDIQGQTVISGRGPLLSQAHWWRDLAMAFGRPVSLLILSATVFWFARRLKREASRYSE